MSDLNRKLDLGLLAGFGGLSLLWGSMNQESNDGRPEDLSGQTIQHKKGALELLQRIQGRHGAYLAVFVSPVGGDLAPAQIYIDNAEEKQSIRNQQLRELRTALGQIPRSTEFKVLRRAWETVHCHCPAHSGFRGFRWQPMQLDPDAKFPEPSDILCEVHLELLQQIKSGEDPGLPEIPTWNPWEIRSGTGVCFIYQGQRVLGIVEELIGMIDGSEHARVSLIALDDPSLKMDLKVIDLYERSDRRLEVFPLASGSIDIEAANDD